jgi:hypothetical protein
MKKIYTKIVSIICILLLIDNLGLSYLYSHEFIHQNNLERYGIASTVEINKLTMSAKTLYYDYNNACNDFCKLENSLTDIVGYFMVVFILNLWTMGIVYFIIRKWK